MRKRLTGLLLGAAALILAGCSAPSAPKVSFYADGDTVRATPLIYCDVLVRQCDQAGNPAALEVRPGIPVQVSIPGEVAETPWKVIVQYRTADGTMRYTRETFTDGEQYAYTADPPGPHAQILVVEVQQLGAAYAADKQGNALLDAAGNPQLVARGVWSLQVEPA